MIHDPTALAEIRAQWTVVRKLRNWNRVWFAEGVCVNETPPAEWQNLPFLLAFAVLDQVLSELSDQGSIPKAGWQFGKKMIASASILPWNDYAAIEKIRDVRNKLAHEGVLLGNAEARECIDSIEKELKAWGIL